MSHVQAYTDMCSARIILSDGINARRSGNMNIYQDWLKDVTNTIDEMIKEIVRSEGNNKL